MERRIRGNVGKDRKLGNCSIEGNICLRRFV
jgi:hypothetical protein